MEATSKRLEELERAQYKSQQHSRRDSTEISGIPTTVQQKDLEAEVIKIYKAADVKVYGKNLLWKFKPVTGQVKRVLPL